MLAVPINAKFLMPVRSWQYYPWGHPMLSSLPTSTQGGHAAVWSPWLVMLKSSCFQLWRSLVHFPSMSAKTVVLTFALFNSSKLTSHSPLFTLFPSNIYISLALITLQPRFLQADPDQVISGASGNLSADSSRLRIIKSWTHKHLQDLEAFQYGFRLDISHSGPS